MTPSIYIHIYTHTHMILVYLVRHLICHQFCWSIKTNRLQISSELELIALLHLKALSLWAMTMLPIEPINFHVHFH